MQATLLNQLNQSQVNLGKDEQPLPEFGRHQDVRRIFGIKRGILYRLINEGKIRSITLREPGRRFGCRLIYLPSVRTYLNSLLEAQTERNPAESTDVPVGSVDCNHRVTRLRLQGRA